MKKILNFCVIIAFAMSSVVCLARDEASINMHFPGHGHDHNNIPIPADMPDVYYYNNTQTIVIDGGGEVGYYDVEIISLTSLNTVISTQVNGYYDTIDVSSLSDGEYTIFIYSPTGYTFDGDFEIY